jgi:hypothetical protein
LVEGWTEFSETWPRSGTMRSGIAYQLPPLVRLTDETDSGLWPTPARSDERQRAMGLAYVEAEKDDLAREFARFAVDEINRYARMETKP